MMRTDLRISRGSLESFLWRYDEQSDEIRRVEVWVLWNYELWWKKKEMAFRSLYRRNWKRGGCYLAKYWRKNLDRSIRVSPLDVWSVTPPKAFNDASRVSKRQKQLWSDGNDPSTCMVLNIFRVLNVIMFTRVKIIVFLLGCEGKIKILRGYCGGPRLELLCWA